MISCINYINIDSNNNNNMTRLISCLKSSYDGFYNISFLGRFNVPAILNIYHAICNQLGSQTRLSKLCKWRSIENEVSIMSYAKICDHNIHPIRVADLRVCAPHLITPTATCAASVQPANCRYITTIDLHTNVTVTTGSTCTLTIQVYRSYF